jgi:hypothetical protein
MAAAGARQRAAHRAAGDGGTGAAAAAAFASCGCWRRRRRGGCAGVGGRGGRRRRRPASSRGCAAGAAGRTGPAGPLAPAAGLCGRRAAAAAAGAAQRAAAGVRVFGCVRSAGCGGGRGPLLVGPGETLRLFARCHTAPPLPRRPTPQHAHARIRSRTSSWVPRPSRALGARRRSSRMCCAAQRSSGPRHSRCWTRWRRGSSAGQTCSRRPRCSWRATRRLRPRRAPTALLPTARQGATLTRTACLRRGRRAAQPRARPGRLAALPAAAAAAARASSWARCCSGRLVRHCWGMRLPACLPGLRQRQSTAGACAGAACLHGQRASVCAVASCCATTLPRPT